MKLLKIALGAAVPLIFFVVLPLFAIFTDDIYYKEVSEIPEHWRGTYTVHPDDHWWDSEPGEKPQSTKLIVGQTKLSYFDESIEASRITIPRFGQGTKKVHVEYKNGWRVELHAPNVREVILQVSAQKSFDSDSWSILGDYRFVVD